LGEGEKMPAPLSYSCCSHTAGQGAARKMFCNNCCFSQPCIINGAFLKDQKAFPCVIALPDLKTPDWMSLGVISE